VRVRCPQCHAEYMYDEARFGSAEKKLLKCSRCSAIFEVVNPAYVEGDPVDATGIGKAEKRVRTVRTPTASIRVEPEPPELPALAPLPKDMRFALAVISGDQAGSVFKITKPRSFIGRGPDMDIQIIDREVSRRHAMLEIRGEAGQIVDLGSTNGTFVDGERVEHATLSHQGEFTIGSTTLMYLVTLLNE